MYKDNNNMHKERTEICDDIVEIGKCNEWDQEKYIDKNGKTRIRLTRKL